MVNLKGLKKHIVPEERLFLNGDVVLLPRELVKEINCYYFALFRICGESELNYV